MRSAICFVVLFSCITVAVLPQEAIVTFRTGVIGGPWCPILGPGLQPLPDSSYVGIYLAGANGVPDPPGPFGVPTNDDVQPTGSNIDHIPLHQGEPPFVPPGNIHSMGNTLVITDLGVEPYVTHGDVIYFRAFNAANPTDATHYNDLITVNGDSATTYTAPGPVGPVIVIICFGEATELGPFELLPEIAVSPEALDFGNVWIGQLAQLPLTIYNIGDTTLVLHDVYSCHACFSTSWDPPDSLISAGDSLEITVYFAPDDSTEYNDTLYIDSNDPAGAMAVPLTGVGIVDFRLISPNGGEEWGVFQEHTVQWVSGGCDELVVIELHRDYPGGSWEILADSTANDSVEVIYINDPLSNHCRIRISAVDGTVSDISDDDFAIVPSQGYLAMITLDQPLIPLVTWEAGYVECNGSSSETFYLKNFGNESIVVFDPEPPIGPYFTSIDSCPPFFALAPEEVSACSLTITYNPSGLGIDHDTLRIMSDAVNAQNGYVHIALSGQQITTPAVPQVTISIEGDDARLVWDPVTESVLGCSIDVTYYLIFYSEIQAGPYFYLAYTPDTTYVHLGAPRFATNLFYEVLAFTDPLDGLDGILIPGIALTREEVLALLNPKLAGFWNMRF
jgi:hypothetical protein